MGTDFTDGMKVSPHAKSCGFKFYFLAWRLEDSVSVENPAAVAHASERLNPPVPVHRVLIRPKGLPLSADD